MNSSEAKYKKIRELLSQLYENNSSIVYNQIVQLIEDWRKNEVGVEKKGWVRENDVTLITYGDSILSDNQNPLATLQKFLNKYMADVIGAIHILPMYPYTSDDGFSVVDYYEIDNKLGTWEDIKSISKQYDMMYDAVINHVSRSSKWFQAFLECDKKYKHYFIASDPEADYSLVTRPRALPLLTAFDTKEGTKHVWTTFSEDQIDLNFKCPEVLIEVMNVLFYYANNGARFIRLDAIGFAWKEIGTTCMHMEQTHGLVKLMRVLLDIVFPGTILITETNVPHRDNISYFGDGYDEAQLVYQFPLPPLVLFSLLTGNANKLSQWAMSLETTPLSETNTYFNFLASHDGIGMRPVEGILTEQEKDMMLQVVENHGGKISYKFNSDASKSPYELNINYMDALTNPKSPDINERVNKFLCAQSILLSVVGVPGIYIHSLLGSQNWYEGVEGSGINRRINREKLYYESLCRELENEGSVRSRVFKGFSNLIRLRRQHTAFSPNSTQRILSLDERAFVLVRQNNETKEEILVIINVSPNEYLIESKYKGIDIITGESISEEIIKMLPYQTRWIKLK